MRHVNIPIFIPHLGCPNMCVFCNQRTISGTLSFDESALPALIDEALSTSGDAECEIAFFGGSFTGIDRALMIRLLDAAQSYVDRGLVAGIRMSTRPDYVDGEIIGILEKYTVSQVELGIQSMSDKVLDACRRGHTSSDTRRAVSLLRDAGFEVVGQMMIGLPSSSSEDEIATAKEICDMGCAAARIYPTVVFRDTVLCAMTESGEYAPLSAEEAAVRSADVLAVFEERGVKCIRIGLCDSENLHSEQTYFAGPSHPALGEVVMSRLFLKKMRSAANDALDKGQKIEGKTLVAECPRGCVSKVVGNGRSNFQTLKEEFKIKRLKTIEKDEIIGYNIKVSFI